MFNDGGSEYSPPSSMGEAFDHLNSVSLTLRKKNMNRRRFSEEQIKSLESIFESESRLEPRKKLQLAGELGLHPRQVAIWFQNKRARWKSKQLERDYGVLRANYNTLSSKFEALRKEKQALALQLQQLNDLMQKTMDETKSCRGDDKSENGDRINYESEEKIKPCLSSAEEIERSEQELEVFSNYDRSVEEAYLELKDPGIGEAAEGSTTSPENWSSLNSQSLLNQTNTSGQWWEFWS